MTRDKGYDACRGCARGEREKASDLAARSADFLPLSCPLSLAFCHDHHDKMDDLANKQTNLREETDRGKTSNDALAKEQEGLKKELDKALQAS